MELVDNFLDLGRNLVPDNIFQVVIMDVRWSLLHSNYPQIIPRPSPTTVFQAALQSAITSYEEMETANATNNTETVIKSVTYRWLILALFPSLHPSCTPPSPPGPGRTPWA